MTTTATEPIAEKAGSVAGDNCVRCDSHVTFTVTLDYGGSEGFRLDHFGVQPEEGDTVTRCDTCGAFWVHGTAHDPAAQPADEEEPAPVEPPASIEPAPVPDTPTEEGGTTNG